MKDAYNKRQNGMELKIQMILRGGKNTQNYTTKDRNEPDYDGVITHLSQTSWTMKSSEP